MKYWRFAESVAGPPLPQNLCKMEHKNLKKQYIGDTVAIFTDSVHTFGTDGVLLSDFACPKRNDKTLEIGIGCGIISLLWCRCDSPKEIHALELQEDAVDLVKMAIQENGLEHRLTIRQGDLKKIESYYAKGFYDLVVMNPPYKKANDGVITPVSGLAIARHELQCNLDDICQAAAKVLNFGGRFCMCHRPARLAEVMVSMKKVDIEPKRLRMVQQRFDSQPNLFLIEGKKGSQSGLTIEAPLIMEGDKGDPTTEIIRIYEEYYKQKDRNV